MLYLAALYLLLHSNNQVFSFFRAYSFYKDDTELFDIGEAILGRIEKAINPEQKSSIDSDSDSPVISTLLAHDVIQSQVMVISQEVALFRRYVTEMTEETLNSDVKYLTKTILMPDELKIEWQKASKSLLGHGKEIDLTQDGAYHRYVEFAYPWISLAIIALSFEK